MRVKLRDHPVYSVTYLQDVSLTGFPSLYNPPITISPHLPTTRSTTVEGEGHSLTGLSEVKLPEIIKYQTSSSRDRFV